MAAGLVLALGLLGALSAQAATYTARVAVWRPGCLSVLP